MGTPAGVPGGDMSRSTYLNLKYHIVFGTKDRFPMISGPWRDRLHSYLGGILRDLGCVSEGVGGTADHIHVLTGLHATHRLCDVVKDIKRGSSEWIHTTLGIRKFAWQEGYGAFTVGQDQVASVRAYIRDQPEHHRMRTFEEELQELLYQNGIELNEKPGV